MNEPTEPRTNGELLNRVKGLRLDGALGAAKGGRYPAPFVERGGWFFCRLRSGP